MKPSISFGLCQENTIKRRIRLIHTFTFNTSLYSHKWFISDGPNYSRHLIDR